MGVTISGAVLLKSKITLSVTLSPAKSVAVTVILNSPGPGGFIKVPEKPSIPLKVNPGGKPPKL